MLFTAEYRTVGEGMYHPPGPWHAIERGHFDVLRDAERFAAEYLCKHHFIETRVVANTMPVDDLRRRYDHLIGQSEAA
jgi:hypothetical protein